MPPVPVLKPRYVVKTLEKLGWEVRRQRGSHIILTKTGHMSTLSVPNHDEVARGTLRSLVARAGLTMDEFLKELMDDLNLVGLPRVAPHLNLTYKTKRSDYLKRKTEA